MAENTYIVEGMDCANCARDLEAGIARLDGVRAVRVDFSSGKLVLEGDVTFDALSERVRAFGHSLKEKEFATAPEVLSPARGGILGFWRYLRTRDDARYTLTGGGLIIAGMVLSWLLLGTVIGIGPEPDTATAPLPEFISGLYALAMLIAVWPIARSGVNTLRLNHTFSINMLMTIAAVGAVIIGEHLEAAMVIFLFAIGEALEGYTADRARDSLRSLMALKPTQATVMHDNHEHVVPVADVQIGDRILVKPGERIPMDGTILQGSSGVDQSPITGESIPVHRALGDPVFAGSINGSGTLEISVTHLAEDNTLSRIIRLVEETQSRKAPSQRMVDTFAHYYTPAVVVIALLVAVIPPLIFNAPFHSTPDEQGWLYRALTMLVIACPCALVISTPVTVISAITAAARRGVLIKGGVFLEALGTINTVAFDKTGTLTQGEPIVTQLHANNGNAGDMLALAAAVERRSTHPLGQAIMRAAREHHVHDRYDAAADVEALAGRGVQGDINGSIITIGSHSLFDERFPHEEALCEALRTAERAGQTTMLVARDADVLGFIAVADAIRSSSREVVAAVNALGLQTVMLTGDNDTVARAIGQQAGVRDVRAGLLPEDKVNAVNDLMAQRGGVVMVGDGVNDTPALAAATVGVAMGGAGTAQALETADVALMADDLAQLPYAIRLARFARQLISQNIVLSIGMKLCFLLLAAFGAASLWIAVFADVGMTLIVTLNGMRARSL